MVRGHQIDHSFFQALPQRFAICAAADWGRTLAQRRAVANLFSRQAQVVRAGFHAQIQPLRARRPQFRQRPTGRKVNDVEAKMIFPAKRQHHANSRKLRFVRPRLQVRGVTLPIGMGEPLCGRVDWTSELRVYQQWQTGPRNMREGCSQILLGNHGETVYARMD